MLVVCDGLCRRRDGMSRDRNDVSQAISQSRHGLNISVATTQVYIFSHPDVSTNRQANN